MATAVFKCVYNPGKPVDGIITYLTRKCGGNVAREKVVGVHGNFLFDPSTYTRLEPWDAVDWNASGLQGSTFSSTDEPNSSFGYDFKERRVTLTSYSICSSTLRSWVLEVANERGEWVVVDSHENEDCSGYSRAYKVRNFTLRDPPSGPFRCVGLRQTGESSSGDDCLNLNALELFGTLYE